MRSYHDRAGTPTPQRKTLIVDTGSHHTAFPCKGCHKCGEHHHTDKYFDPDASKTFRALTCRECLWGASCEAVPLLGERVENDNAISNGEEQERPRGCVFQQSYTEGSSWKAFQVQDIVFVGGKDVFSAADPIATRYSVDFTFGCQTYSSGLFVSQLADGIMGLSQHDATLPRAMYNQGKLRNRMFGLCFRTEMVVSKKGISAGVLTLGGIDRRLDSSPMVYAKNLARSGWFTVYVKKLYLRPGGGQSAKIEDSDKIIPITTDLYSMNSGKGVIIDSGTTDTYLHRSLSKPFNAAWKSITGKAYSNSPVRLTRQQIAELPTILIQLMPYSSGFDDNLGSPNDVIGLAGSRLDDNSPNDILIAVPATHYMEYSPSKDVYTSRFYFTESRGGVLGANTLQGHDVVFDWDYGRIGFAESTCKVSDPRDEKAGLVSEGADARGNDCILQNPVITKSCQDTIDTTSCNDDNPDEVLEGVEEWAMVVDYPGMALGLGCEDVIRHKMMPNEDQTSGLEVTCNGSGLCTTKQKCQLACRYVRPLEPQQEQSDESITKSCSVDSWGSCLESCRQAKLTSAFMSDGRCHENQSKREERECHTEYCGISDPCLIPFVVHVILAFRGVDHKTWTKESETTIIEAFSDSVKNGQHKQIFKPSDVELLMVSPWTEDVIDIGGSTMGEIESLGTKIVMEVHMYNDNAITPSDNMDHTPHENEGGGDFSHKISVMLRSKLNPQHLSECKSSDIFGLAQKAHEIHYVLGEDSFMRTLSSSLKKDPLVEDNASTFSPMISVEDFVDQSIVFSSWTIKTEVGGGSVYDHKLDPYPSAIHYVKVSPAYFGFFNLKFLAYLLLPLIVTALVARRRQTFRERNDDRFLILSPSAMTYCPKPFEIVKRKLRARKKGSEDDAHIRRQHYTTESDIEHFPTLIANRRGSHSRLSDLINN